MEESKPSQTSGTSSTTHPWSLGDSKTIILFVVAIAAIVGVVLAFINQNYIDKLKRDADNLYSKSEKSEKKVINLEKRVAAFDAPLTYVQEQIEKDKYQAVFLVGGQVYFGKITHIDATTLTIEDIYYLRVGNYQQGDVVSNDASLVKLGNELHGPKDKMVIERKNVTFWENLKTNGKVAEAIKQYQKEQKSTHPRTVVD